MIVGITGRKHCGKSTLARHIVQRYQAVELTFAGPLKLACQAIFGLTDEQVHGSLKETIDPYWGRTPRHIMQRLGTDVMRTHSATIVDIPHSDEIWLRCMERKIREVRAPVAVISDVRFDNEAALVRRLGGVLVRIERGGSEDDDGHASERGVSTLCDFILDNCGTETDMFARFDQLLLDATHPMQCA